MLPSLSLFLSNTQTYSQGHLSLIASLWPHFLKTTWKLNYKLWRCSDWKKQKHNTNQKNKKIFKKKTKKKTKINNISTQWLFWKPKYYSYIQILCSITMLTSVSGFLVHLLNLVLQNVNTNSRCIERMYVTVPSKPLHYCMFKKRFVLKSKLCVCVCVCVCKMSHGP